jgi:hypothetical protein
MNGLFLPLVAAGAASAPYVGLNTLGVLWASVSVSVGGATLAVDALDAVGGRSSGPLRPQPASASAVRLKTMMAHPEPAGRNFDVTTKSPLRAAHHTEIGALWRDPDDHET